MIDKLMSINLENSTLDYKYKGKLLDKDVLKNYVIQSDHEKIKLEVVHPIDEIKFKETTI